MNIIEKEKIAGAIIYTCLAILSLTVIIERLFNVKVLNIESVDRDLYTIITDAGPVNIIPDDIIRVESSYTKSAIRDTLTEQNRIYTKKGFLNLTSIDNFFGNGKKLLEEIGPITIPVWERKNVNPKIIDNYLFAIGTPYNLISLMKFIVEIQYLALTIGGITLIILVSPFSISKQDTGSFEKTTEELGDLSK